MVKMARPQRRTLCDNAAYTTLLAADECCPAFGGRNPTPNTVLFKSSCMPHAALRHLAETNPSRPSIGGLAFCVPNAHMCSSADTITNAWLAFLSPSASSLRSLEASAASGTAHTRTISNSAISTTLGTDTLILESPARRRIQSKTALLLTWLGTLTGCSDSLSERRPERLWRLQCPAPHPSGDSSDHSSTKTHRELSDTECLCGYWPPLEARHPRETDRRDQRCDLPKRGCCDRSRCNHRYLWFCHPGDVDSTDRQENKTRPALETHIPAALGTVIGLSGVLKIISSAELRKTLSTIP